MVRQYARHVTSPRVAVLLEAARRTRGLSVRGAARELGVSQTHLWQIEGCQRAPSVALAVDLARAYRLSPADTADLLAESVDSAGYSRPSRRR
jgi:transcriptional regulator with XRE-family HTH domain